MELLLLRVRAVPGAERVIEPLEEMVTSEGAPLFAVAVATGVVVPVEMVTWARAGNEAAKSGATAAAAARNLRFMNGTRARRRTRS